MIRSENLRKAAMQQPGDHKSEVEERAKSSRWNVYRGKNGAERLSDVLDMCKVVLRRIDESFPIKKKIAE